MKLKFGIIKGVILLFCTVFAVGTSLNAQPGPGNAQFRSPGTNVWLGNYYKFRFSNKLFWDAQTHFRTGGHNGVPYVGRMAQIYNRHGLSYRATPNFVFTIGPVLRLNFTPDPGNPEFKTLVLEPRIWHEYLFAIPFERFIIYHRLRVEHRWSIGNRFTDEWIYRNRWRYKFYMTIPLNKKQLVPKTWFFTPDVEIIMQSGKAVGGSPMEDLRIYPQIGYIQNARFKYTAGMMYAAGQTLSDAYIYNTRWVFRLNLYMSLDFRKLEDKIPEIRIFD